MVDTELAGLTEDTAADATDLLYLVDAAGTSDKRITVANLAGSPPFTAAVSEKTADYTLAVGDEGDIISVNSGTAKVITFPQNSDAAITVGTSGWLYQAGAGGITTAAGAGATVLGLGATTTAGNFSKWLKVGTNTFALESVEATNTIAFAAHVLVGDPHPGYALESALLAGTTPVMLDLAQQMAFGG